jgi:hypothetical protein
MSLWYVVRLNTYLDLVSYLKDTKIRFNCKSNLMSAIGNLSKSQHLASYVSRHDTMAYDRLMQSLDFLKCSIENLQSDIKKTLNFDTFLRVFVPPTGAQYHLLTVLLRYHQVQTNMAGNKIASLNVQWDFPSKRVHIDMKSYVNNLLLSLNWPMPKKPQLLPITATPIAFDQKT